MNLPKITVRLFSSDQFLLDKCFYSNFYKIRGIPKSSIEKPIVVDIGANAGYFTIAALALGAKKVYAFEPFIENYKALLENTNNNSMGQVSVFPVGVYTNDTILSLMYPKIENSYLNLSDIVPPLSSDKDIKIYNSQCFSLDNLLANFIEEQTIDILKINIGYAERDILKTSLLNRITSICGQVAIEEKDVIDFKTEMLQKGFSNSRTFSMDEDNGILFFFSKENIEKHFKFE
jgi:FkbM family methyltransferase